MLYLNRSASTISRELARDCGTASAYTAALASEQADRWRLKRRKDGKLVVGGVLFGIVVGHLKKKWSPKQVAGIRTGILKRMHPDQLKHWISHETIYHTPYAMPRGELRRTLIGCLRWSRDIRLFKHFSA